MDENNPEAEGEWLFLVIRLPCYNCFISYLIGQIHARHMVLAGPT